MLEKDGMLKSVTECVNGYPLSQLNWIKISHVRDIWLVLKINMSMVESKVASKEEILYWNYLNNSWNQFYFGPQLKMLKLD